MSRKFPLVFIIMVALALALPLAGCGSQTAAEGVPTPPPYTPLPGSALASSVTVEPVTGDAQAGAAVFEEHCSECHSTEEAVTVVGPSLYRAGDRLRFSYVKTSIENPHDYGVWTEEDFGAEMPTDLTQRLSEEELDNVIAYVISLSDQ